MSRMKSRKAFTIVELVIVIAVIAILATVLVPAFGEVVQNAKDSAAKQEAKNAYTEYIVENAGKGEMPELFLYKAEEGRVVALLNGAVVGVYESEDAALTALGLEEDAKLTNTGDGKLFAYGGEVPEAGESGKPISFAGKKISILGDSISTFRGVSNSTEFNSTLGSNAAHYPDMYNLTRADTWWQQVIDSLGMKLCVNNSWSGSWILSHTASGGYGNRCVNLHNDQTGEEPDVIVVYMGTNDFGNGKATFGKASDIDYQTLIIAKDDGTYDYATPTTSCEAYAIMLHKIQQRYPDAEIFCMTLLPDRNPDHPTDGRGYGSPAPYNAELRKIISYFDCALVDLEYCIDRTGEVFDQYFADYRIHPNQKGMDAISDALISVMQGNTVSMDDMNANATVFLNGNDGGLIDSFGAYKLVSDYIEIPEGHIISKFCSITHMDGTNAYCAFYDANKNFISAYKPATGDGTVTGDWKYTETPPVIPAGAKYIRVAFNDGLEGYNPSLEVVKREYALLEFAYDIQPTAAQLTANIGYSLTPDGRLKDYNDKHYMIVSDLIRIPEGAIITNFASLAYSSHAYCAFYASNNADSFISAVVPNAETDIHVYGNLYYGSTTNPDIPEGAKYIRIAYNAGFAGGDYNVPTDLSIANQGRPILTFGYPEEIEFVASNVDLFVFAGQSNMQGASVLAPQITEFTNMALEYKYMPKLRGQDTGNFVLPSIYTGESHYMNLAQAYGANLKDLSYKSELVMYPSSSNVYFRPAGRNDQIEFREQTEANFTPGASLPPLFATEYAEKYEHSSIYAHMALGGCKIDYYFSTEMRQQYNTLIQNYNSQNGTNYGLLSTTATGADQAFDDKYRSMLYDYEELYPSGTIANKCFVWLQGESDPNISTAEYKLRMKVLWEHLRDDLGFTHFFVLRVGYWDSANIINIIRAQEEFCEETENCYIVTRAPSLIPHDNAPANWFNDTPSSEYNNCRDNAINGNFHFNEKAMQIFAERSAANIHRILHEGQEPILEDENLTGMISNP